MPPKLQVSATESAADVRDFSLAQSMKCPQFWMLALVFLTVCMSGLYVIGVAKDIGQGYVHLSLDVAAAGVAIIAVANLGGRLVLGVLSDKIARTKGYRNCIDCVFSWRVCIAICSSKYDEFLCCCRLYCL